MRPFLRSFLVTILFLLVLAFTQSDFENILQVQPFASLMTLSLRERGASQTLQGRYRRELMPGIIVVIQSFGSRLIEQMSGAKSISYKFKFESHG
jgi:hypothetical protein